ncbi:MAG: caspase family protein [Xanthobacteraceae bacterium]|jgi:TPR repeat protein/uncharacterized caspase-like protein
MDPCASFVSKLIAAAAIFGTCLSLSVPAHAEKRVALVIGNSAYKVVPRLDNPKNDATLMAETLRSLGFTLVGDGAQLDLDKSGIDRAVQNFGDLLQGADVGLFYYAGHGIQVRGANYLVPVDANPTRESDVDFQMLDSDLVLRQMTDAGTKLNFVILDACRNNPFPGRGLRATGGGLGQMQAPEGTLISFATQPGNVAKDGADGNSPFTKALAQTIKRPGLGIFEAFNEVGLLVMQATGNAQLPWYSTSPIRGKFYFAEAPASGPPPAAEEPGTPTKEARLTNPADTLRPDLVTDCDRLAAHPLDDQRPRGVTGVLITDTIDVVPALRACSDVMRQYPDVARFVFEAGRVAYAQKDYATARQLFEKATGMGSKIAIADVGVIYMNGQGVAKDYTKARQLFEEAIAKGDHLAEVSLGSLYQNGWGVAQDYAQARQWFEKAAAAGAPAAMNSLGVLYGNGLGVPKDYTQARQWYEKAAAAGNALAMQNLGWYYQYGLGVAQDYAQARQWYEKAAAAGNAIAMNSLGILYQKGLGASQDYTQARQWYEKAAAAGGPASMNSLGVFYQNGWGVAQDYTQARQWYEKAAAAGNSDAMRNLGLLYESGLGGIKDYAAARQWFEKAVAAGDVGAMTNLGFLYDRGWGVPRDGAQARQWYEKAAAAGESIAMGNLGVLYRDGSGVAKDYTQARQWFEKAAALGNNQAMNNLGVMYGTGTGVAKDLTQARQWYEKAAAAGNEVARQNLQKIGRRR